MDKFNIAVAKVVELQGDFIEAVIRVADECEVDRDVLIRGAIITLGNSAVAKSFAEYQLGEDAECKSM